MTVRVPLYEMGRLAGEILIRGLGDQPTPDVAPIQVMLPVRGRRRGSD